MIVDRNTTDWRTEDLNAVIEAAFEHRGADPSRCETIRVEHTRRPRWKRAKWRYSGRCWSKALGCRRDEIYLGVPKVEDTDGFNVERFAQVVLHEIDHMLGLEHRDMEAHWKLDTSFVNGHVVRTSGDSDDR